MGRTGLGGEASAGASSGRAARIRVPERASIPSCAWPCASAAAGGVRHRIGSGSPTAPGQRRTTMDNTDTWEVSDGLTSFRTVLQRFAMETTSDGACSPISRPREGAGAVRTDGPSGSPWRACMAACSPAPSSRYGFGSTASGRRNAARHRARKVGSPTTQPGIDAPWQVMACPRASLERGAREYVEEADAAR